MEAIIGAHILLFSHDIKQGAILTFELGVALHVMKRFCHFSLKGSGQVSVHAKKVMRERNVIAAISAIRVTRSVCPVTATQLAV